MLTAKRSALIVFAIVLFLPSRAAAATPGYLRPVRGPIIRHFEPPPTPYAAGHRGIDMAVPVGTAVVASNEGIVAFAGAVATELFVSIDHPDGIRTTYSYLSAVSVGKGDAVARGQRIALSGPGHAGATQPHLHFGMRVGDGYIDPEPLLIDGLRRDLSQAIRLAPENEGSGEPDAARASIPVDPPAPVLAGMIALRAAARRRSARGSPRDEVNRHERHDAILRE